MFGRENYLVPRNTRQYLYKISPLANSPLTKRTSLSVGKMDIVGRSKFGDRGRIQTGQLKAAVSPNIYTKYATILELYILIRYHN